MLHVPPKTPAHQRPYHLLPLTHNAQTYGQEAFYVAECLRDMLTVARCPHHVTVCNQYHGERWVRLALPWPCPIHVATWVHHICRTARWTARSVTYTPFNQVFELAEAVPPIIAQHWQVSTNATHPPKAPRSPATCQHGRTLDALCPVCDEDCPW